MCFGGAAILERERQNKQQTQHDHRVMLGAYRVLSKVEAGEGISKQALRAVLFELEETLDLPRQMKLVLG